MRIILYTGKGGVGKTSISAATALKMAREGEKVLIMSTDQAHSLGDSFEKKLSNKPLEIEENLYAAEIDTVLENEAKWGKLKDYLKKIMFSKNADTIENEELLVFPGFDELLSLIKIKEINDEGKFDVLIVDCAPTGETMSLLKFPELFKWWMEKIFPIKRKAAKIAKPVVESTIKIPIPDDKTFDEIELLYSKIDELHKFMLDKTQVSIRIVTTPEKIVVKEAKKSFSYFHLFGFNVDAIIVNKIFSKEGASGYFQKWFALQNDSIQDICQSFNPIPVFKVELMDDEVRGCEKLFYLGNHIYNEANPCDILFEGKIFEIKKASDDSWDFSISVPFIDKKDMDLYQRGDELSISIKNEKRNFVLPQKLHSKEISGASYRDGKLVINFK